jgi:hypothetical protein
MEAGCHFHATAVLPSGKQPIVLTRRKSSRTPDKTRAFSTQDSDGEEWVPLKICLKNKRRNIFGYLRIPELRYLRRLQGVGTTRLAHITGGTHARRR